jgi:hypothetical protein
MMDIAPNLSAPRDAREIATTKVVRFARDGSLLYAAGPSKFGLSFPHRIFWLSSRDLRSGDPLIACAQPRGWRFLVLADKHVTAAVETWYDRGAWQVSMVRAGITEIGMEAALEEALYATPSPPGRFEACYLWCWATRTAVVWLRPWGGGDGYIVPLPGAMSPRTVNSIVDGQTFLQAQQQSLRNMSPATTNPTLATE